MTDGFKPLNLAQVYQGADASIASALQANLLMMQSSKLSQEYKEEDALRGLARTSTTTDAEGTPTFDLKTFTRGAYSINPMKGLAFEKAGQEAKKTALETENVQGQIDERRMKQAADRLKHMNEASTVPYMKYRELVDGGMPDAQARQQVQPLHEAAAAQLISSGIFTQEQLKNMKVLQSPQFDPTTAEAGMRFVLGAKDQLAEYWKKRDFGQKEQHHQDSQRVQIRGQNITLRGQNLTDARAKEQLAQQGLEIKDNEDGTYSVIHKATGVASPVLDQNGQPLRTGKSAGTEGERVSAGYATRMTAAEQILGTLTTGNQTPGALESLGGAVPVAGAVIANQLRGEDRQKAVQAQADWVRAKLRKESGAVIGPKEMEDEIRTYFPQLGDEPGVITQKAEARRIAADGMVSAAGRAYKAPAAAAAAPKPAAGAEPKVSNQADYDKISEGQPYIDPKGVRRIKGQKAN